MNLDAALKKITRGETLSGEEAQSAMGDIMDGTASPLQIAAMLGALKMRGETVEEIGGFARAMRSRAVKVNSHRAPLVDTCGTGGDSPKHGIATFNVSTAAAVIAAAAGVHVAKHGNRAMSSKCGSADVLEALGVNLNLSAEGIGACLDEIGLAFMFAQNHHPAMKHAAPIRRELGFRTIFNLLGPLANPADASAQVMGVSDARWIRPIAEVLLALGSLHAIVCHAEDGLDEFSTCAPTHLIEIQNGELRESVFHPHELGLACADPQLLAGGDAAQNAEIIQQLLQNGGGATTDIACLNAAAVIVVAEIAPDFREGLRLARAAIESGAAREKLAQLVEFSNRI